MRYILWVAALPRASDVIHDVHILATILELPKIRNYQKIIKKIFDARHVQYDVIKHCCFLQTYCPFFI